MIIRAFVLLIPLLLAAPLVTAEGPRVEERVFVGATFGASAFLIGCENEVDPACLRIEEGETRVSLRVVDPFGLPVSYVVRFQSADDGWQDAFQGPFCGESHMDIPEGAPALYVEVNPASITCARLVAGGFLTATFT